MATLEDELKADFLDLESDGENEDDVDENDEGHLNGDANGDVGMGDADEDNAAAEDDEDGEDKKEKLDRAIDGAEDESEAKKRVEKINLRGVSDFKSIAQLWTKLRPVLEQIDEYQALSAAEQAKRNLGKSDSPAYKLMNDANSLSTHIDSEIIVLHKWIRDHYSAFFAGLERLVENPVQYAKAVAIIGNGPMDAKAIGTTADNVVGQPLDKVLEKALLMSVRMEAATTKTTPLSTPEMKMIFKACEMVLALDNAKERIRTFVQDRMAEHCPNLTTLIGAETAALLVQACGGIQGLASKPSANLGNIGWKFSRTGQATNAYGGGARQKGFIYYSPIVKNVPIDHRTQAIRIVAAKITLAARTDAVARTPDNSIGRQLAEDVARRLDVLTEAAPNRGPRALPAPDDKPARKRGGKRARAAKARDAQSELSKMANRMAFGKEEAQAGFGTGDSTVGLGMIGQETGKIRQTGVDKRTQARLSKKTQAIFGTSGGGGGSGLATSLRGFGPGASAGTVTGLRTSGVGTSLGGGGAGTASVIAFTDKGFGLELADPRNRDEVERKRKAEEDKYFKTGTFTNVGGGSASVLPQQSQVDSGGFKVPALPALKRVKKDG